MSVRKNCELCDECIAEVYCNNCKMYFCKRNDCDAEMHADKLKSHNRTQLSVLLDENETETGKFNNNEIKSETDMTVQGVGKEEKSDIKAPDCDVCYSNPPVVGCKECDMNFCADCDGDIHVGNQKRHIRHAVDAVISNRDMNASNAHGTSNARSSVEDKEIKAAVLNRRASIALDIKNVQEEKASVQTRRASVVMNDAETAEAESKANTDDVEKYNTNTGVSEGLDPNNQHLDTLKLNIDKADSVVVATEKVIVREIIHAPSIPAAPSQPGANAPAHAFFTTSDGVQMYLPKNFSFCSKNGVICAFPENTSKEEENQLQNHLFGAKPKVSHPQQQQQQIVLAQPSIQPQQQASPVVMQHIPTISNTTFTAMNTENTNTVYKNSQTSVYKRLKQIESNPSSMHSLFISSTGKFLRRRLATVHNTHQSTYIHCKDCRSRVAEEYFRNREVIGDVQLKLDKTERRLQNGKVVLLRIGGVLLELYEGTNQNVETSVETLRCELFDIEKEFYELKTAIKEQNETLDALQNNYEQVIALKVKPGSNAYITHHSTSLPKPEYMPLRAYSSTSTYPTSTTTQPSRLEQLQQQKDLKSRAVFDAANYVLAPQEHHPKLTRHPIAALSTNNADSDEELDQHVDVHKGYEWLREDEVVRTLPLHFK